ncbi:hypothetical protein F5Y08DRAFT_333252 [Xylaria arbuscula]|nr:hypothetical protein F5Y08DRAFT_333252 [Xylaria arbuscula]
MATNSLIESQLRQAVEDFKTSSNLSRDELRDFSATTFTQIESVIASIQQKQAQSRRLMYMRRLEPFLKTMAEYGKVVEVFGNISPLVAFIWGPMKFLIMISSSMPAAFNSLLKIYEQIGEQIPLLSEYSDFFSENAHMRDVLVLIFKDILAFHLEAVRFFKQKGFEGKIDDIKQNLSRHCYLVESRANLVEFQQIRDSQRYSDARLLELRDQGLSRRRESVLRWLSAASIEAVHEGHVHARSENPDAGLWLLNDPHFQKWFDPIFCSTPLLWLNGIPGAGKSVLASVIVDKAKQIQGVSVVAFYCAGDDPLRNNFVSLARSLLTQLIVHHDPLVEMLDTEMCTKSGEAVLSSKETAKRLLSIALKMGKVYIILDGIDECPRDQRKEICSWFREIVDSLPRTDMDQIRCLFISQDDGVGRKDLSKIPTITITPGDNQVDIEKFSRIWQVAIEREFGAFKDDLNITEVVTARSQGMFIFAKCALEELMQQPSRQSLLAEWKADVFPSALNELYDRILKRILQKSIQARRRVVLQLLGWISCSKRPLRWHEIQAGITIDLQEQRINGVNDRLVHDCKDLLSSLIIIRTDDVVDLVHPTLKQFLFQNKHVQESKVHQELCNLCVEYLCFPIVSSKTIGNSLDAAVQAGAFAFYDYAVAHWVEHLLSWLPHSTEGEIHKISEYLEAMLDIHFTEPRRPHNISKTIKEKLKPLEVLDIYNSLTQAVVWTRKCRLVDIADSNETPLLDFPLITTNFREALERLSLDSSLPSMDTILRTYYGCLRFKCPKSHCEFSYGGFSKPEDRGKHVDRHDRAYYCIMEGCPIATFGCVTEKDLAKHLRETHQVYGLDDFPELPQAKPSAGDKQKHPSMLQCHLCPKRFTRKHNLQSHLSAHIDERPFSCTFCGKSFNRQHDRKRHETLHSGEKGLFCKGVLKDGGQWGCGRRFVGADALDQHFQSEAGRICIKPLMDEEIHKHMQDQTRSSPSFNPQHAADFQPEQFQPLFDIPFPEPLLTQHLELNGFS